VKAFRHPQSTGKEDVVYVGVVDDGGPRDGDRKQHPGIAIYSQKMRPNSSSTGTRRPLSTGAPRRTRPHPDTGGRGGEEGKYQNYGHNTARQGETRQPRPDDDAQYTRTKAPPEDVHPPERVSSKGDCTGGRSASADRPFRPPPPEPRVRQPAEPPARDDRPQRAPKVEEQIAAMSIEDLERAAAEEDQRIHKQPRHRPNSVKRSERKTSDDVTAADDHQSRPASGKQKQYQADRPMARPATPCMNSRPSSSNCTRRQAPAAGARSRSAGRAGKRAVVPVAPGLNTDLMEEALRRSRPPRPATPVGRDSDSSGDELPTGNGWPWRDLAQGWIERPPNPTPEKTGHWTRDLDGDEIDQIINGTLREPSADDDDPLGDHRPANPRSEPLASPGSPGAAERSPVAFERPRSPTPTKMLAWEAEESAQETKDGQSPDEGDASNADARIARLINACQQDDLKRAFQLYDKLRRMEVRLFEGVYKLLIESCIRAQRLDLALRLYEALKVSGQRPSNRLVCVLAECCAREMQGDKVHAIWRDWCIGAEAEHPHPEVVATLVLALIRTMLPGAATEVLVVATRWAAEDMEWALCSEHVDEMITLARRAAEDAGGMPEVASEFAHLNHGLGELRRCTRRAAPVRQCSDIVMEDVELDVDLDFADL